MGEEGRGGEGERWERRGGEGREVERGDGKGRGGEGRDGRGEGRGRRCSACVDEWENRMLHKSLAFMT